MTRIVNEVRKSYRMAVQVVPTMFFLSGALLLVLGVLMQLFIPIVLLVFGLASLLVLLYALTQTPEAVDIRQDLVLVLLCHKVH